MRKYCLLVLVAFVLLTGCGENTPPLQESSMVTEQVQMNDQVAMGRGISLSPKSFNEEDLKDFFTRLSDFDILRWGGTINEFAGEGAPKAVVTWAGTYGLSAMLSTNLYDPQTPLDDQAVNELLAFVTEHKPAYVELGVEVNSKFKDDEAAIKAYAKTFNEVASQIKTLSSETQVLVTFQYEWLLGLRDGLFGSSPAEATWHYLDLFESDMIGFTTYPCLYYQDPSEIPNTYYSQIGEHTTKPLAFTEIGWYSDAQIPGWESSEEEQLRFVQRFNGLIKSLDARLVVWSFMYEIFDQQPFKTMALMTNQGTEKPAYEAFVKGKGYDRVHKALYFVSRADHPAGEIYRLNPDGGIERLTFNDRHENNVALSFDGMFLAYHGGVEEDLHSYEIYVMDLFTYNETQVTDNQLLDGHPDWYPTGDLIYASFDNGQGQPSATADLYTYNLMTQTRTRLTDSPYEDNDPEVSKDGQWITFKSTRRTKEPGKEEIFVMKADGTQVKPLTRVTGWESDHDPSWSDDGRTIVFERFEGTRIWTDISKPDILMSHIDQLTPWHIYQVNLEGSLSQLTLAEKNEIDFLPVYNGVDLAYIHMTFIKDNDQIIGADKSLFKYFGKLDHPLKLLYDTKHRYTLEYFDW